MSKKIIRTVEIQAGINSGYLENTLTTDISVLESIFDLIDNSIDAARDHLLTQKIEVDKYGLPNDYSKYNISIRFDDKSISILDNCLGMDEFVLTQQAFITANVSDHKFGIGHYGLGLKRALLKFGSQYAMSSDTGNIAFKMHFNAEMIAGNLLLVASEYESTGRRKTLFIVTGIKKHIAFEFKSRPWFENAVKMLKIRYAIYTAKGLKLSITNSYSHEHVKISWTIPSLRTDAKFQPVSMPLKVDDVDIYIDSGIHHEYYFKKENKDSLTKNKELTNDFGLYFICNDRVIVAASTATEHGWKTKWHSEYNGYICVVRFVSPDSSKMPWNTIKTALKTDGSMLMEVKGKLLAISEDFRSLVRKNYLNKKPKDVPNNLVPVSISPIEQQKNNNAFENKPTQNSNARQNVMPSQMAGNNQNLHVKNWKTLLPKEFPHSTHSVLNAFLIDALSLDCNAAPCASALLLRAILEKSFREFVDKSSNFQKVKDHFYSSAEGMKKKHNDEQKTKQGVDLAMMLNWLKDENVAISVFGVAEKPTLWLATKKASAYVSKLNGVAHGLDFVDTGQVKEIRNEIYQLLLFFVINSQAPKS